MDNEQIQSLISQLKAVGLEDEQIMDVFYEAFTKGKMDRKDLETLAESLGYELDDDFKAEPTPDPIEGDKPAEGGDVPAGAEDLKEIKPGESVEEFKDKVEEAKGDGEGDVEEEEDKEESHEDDDNTDTDEGDDDGEDKEWDEANKYFKI